MTAPSFVSVTNSGETTNRTTFSVSVPAVNAGDRLICVIGHGSASAVGGTAPTDWTKLNGSDTSLSVYERIFSGGASAGTVTFSQDISNWWGAQVIRISGSHATDASQLSTRSNANSSSAPNTNSLTPSGGSKDYLWFSAIAFGLAGFSTQPSISAWPTNYTSVTVSNTSNGFGQVAVACGYRALTASSEDPDAYTLSNTNGNWYGYTIAVPPADPGNILTPGAATLTLTAQTPRVAKELLPGAGSLSATAQTPTIAAAVIPIVASLAITAQSPALNLNNTLMPGAGSLALTAQTARKVLGVIPTAGALSLTAQTAKTALELKPGTGSLALTAQTAKLNTTINPGAGSLTATPKQAALANLIIASFQTLTLTAQNVKLVNTLLASSSTLSLIATAANLNTTIFPGAASATLTAQTPKTALELLPGAATLSLTSFPAEVRLTSFTFGQARYAPFALAEARHAVISTGEGRYSVIATGESTYRVIALGEARG